MIYDFNIETESGFCSLTHCLTVPTETKEQIEAYFRNWGTPEMARYCESAGYNFHKCPLVLGLMAGEEVFNPDGTLI